jgi:hypothetical protein
MAPRRVSHHPLTLLASPIETDVAEFIHQMCLDHSSRHPLAQIDSDMRIMRTNGYLIGTVVNIAPPLGLELFWSSPDATGMCALRDLCSQTLHPHNISMEQLLMAFRPPAARDLIDELEKDLMVVFGVDGSEQEPGPSGAFLEGLEQMAALNLTERTMFVTDNQLIGVCYAASDSIQPRDELVGLFGINFPFLLHLVEEGTHRIINVTYFSGHRWARRFSVREREKAHERHKQDKPSHNLVGEDDSSGVARNADDATWHDPEVHSVRDFAIVLARREICFGRTRRYRPCAHSNNVIWLSTTSGCRINNTALLPTQNLTKSSFSGPP